MSSFLEYIFDFNKKSPTLNKEKLHYSVTVNNSFCSLKIKVVSNPEQVQLNKNNLLFLDVLSANTTKE